MPFSKGNLVSGVDHRILQHQFDEAASELVSVLYFAENLTHVGMRETFVCQPANFVQCDLCCRGDEIVATHKGTAVTKAIPK
jgi:hypothetical protein